MDTIPDSIPVHGYVDPVSGNISIFSLGTKELIEPGEVRGMTIFESKEVLDDIQGQRIVNNPVVRNKLSAPKAESNTAWETIQNNDSSRGILNEFLEFTNDMSEVNEIDFEKEWPCNTKSK